LSANKKRPCNLGVNRVFSVTDLSSFPLLDIKIYQRFRVLINTTLHLEGGSPGGLNVLSQSLPQNTKPKPPVKRKKAHKSAIKPLYFLPLKILTRQSKNSRLTQSNIDFTRGMFMTKILALVLGLSMFALTPAVGNADTASSLINDSVLIQKYQKELDAGNLEVAYKYINQVKSEMAKMSGINIIYMQAIAEQKCSLAKLMLNEWKDIGMGIKDNMKLQYDLSGC
jgi:hypothetical protein